MTRFLLDTNILSDSMRDPRGRAATRIRATSRAHLCTSIIVAAELRFGALKRRSIALRTKIDELLDLIEVLSFEAPADECYGIVRATLERDGVIIGANDLLIAAHAIALGCTLVTNNEREFRRVPGLRIENWTI